MKQAALYAHVSTADQHVENQLLDLRKLAAQRGFEVVREYSDRGISGSKARRPGLDAMMADARRGEFSVLMVAAFDRIARSTKNFLEIVDELHELGIEFISAREAKGVIDDAQSDGLKIVTVPENIKNSLRGISDLQGNPVRDLSVYKSEWEKSFEFKLVPVDKLSKSEMTVFGQRKGFSFWGCLYLYYGGFDPRIPRFTPPSPPSRGIQKQGT